MGMGGGGGGNRAGRGGVQIYPHRLWPSRYKRKLPKLIFCMNCHCSFTIAIEVRIRPELSGAALGAL